MSATPVAITMGDPAGIGPEIVARLFSEPPLAVPAIVIGDAGVLRRVADLLAIPVDVREISRVGEARFQSATLEVIAETHLPADLPVGKVDRRCGAAAFAYVKRGIELALAGEVAAIVTAPIHKEALSAAGIRYPGHTEILADLTGTRDYAMMLMNDELRVILVSIHVSLRQAIEAIDGERESKTIRLAHRACRQLGISAPRIAVAGLNPHAGEGGLFGSEDRDIIAPAIARARAEGMDVTGPFAPDTVFMRARRGEFDIVVAQYHDQGLIPVKYLGIDHGVNITVGLPFVRTSVDHGTAFDIAGQGIADASSLRVALSHAAALVAGGMPED
jgi:4-hydroxythreonine-4-phosphate dehydrogenase